MNSILILTPNYLRWRQDSEPVFVRLLCRQLSRRYQIMVLAPRYPAANRREALEAILVYRFRYFHHFAEHHDYDGGIITSLKKDSLKLFLAMFFLAGQLFNIYRLYREQGVRLCIAQDTLVETDEDSTTLSTGLCGMTAGKFIVSLRSRHSHRNIAELGNLFRLHYPIPCLYPPGVALNLLRNTCVYLADRALRIFSGGRRQSA